jgi:hypothetical protein
VYFSDSSYEVITITPAVRESTLEMHANKHMEIFMHNVRYACQILTKSKKENCSKTCNYTVSRKSIQRFIGWHMWRYRQTDTHTDTAKRVVTCGETDTTKRVVTCGERNTAKRVVTCGEKGTAKRVITWGESDTAKRVVTCGETCTAKPSTAFYLPLIAKAPKI